MKRIFDWIESRLKAKGFWPEVFRLSVCGLTFGVCVWFVEGNWKKGLEYVTPMEPVVARYRDDVDNKKIVKEAKSQWLDVQVKACEIKSKTRGALVKCLSEINEGEM